MMNDPILLTVPEQIDTRRLRLRVPRAGDGVMMHEAFQESKERLERWFGWANREHTLMSEEQFVREQAARFYLREVFTYFLIDLTGDQFLGAISLYSRDWAVPVFEIGYWLRTGCEGRGWISEAVDCLTQMAFEVLNAQRVMIRVDERNLRSQAVAVRCGYCYEATFRNSQPAYDHDGMATMKIYSMTPDNYADYHNIRMTAEDKMR
ncbi:MAG: GNAT family N-acetyltransferase [Anaerolineaceae bacterium]|nr:GNAT family N-acetyltransferase [Anaerolineaceae bacterium]